METLNLRGGTPWGFRIEVDSDRGYLLVAKVRSQSKADQVGLRDGDFVTAINGQDVRGWEKDQAMELIDSAMELNLDLIRGQNHQPVQESFNKGPHGGIPMPGMQIPQTRRLYDEDSIIGSEIHIPGMLQTLHEPTADEIIDFPRPPGVNRLRARPPAPSSVKSEQLGTVSERPLFGIPVMISGDQGVMRNPRKKTYADSSFYDDGQNRYPTVQEQLKLAKKVSKSLQAAQNQQARGYEMFMNRKQNAPTWELGPNGTDCPGNGQCPPQTYDYPHRYNTGSEHLFPASSQALQQYPFSQASLDYGGETISAQNHATGWKPVTSYPPRAHSYPHSPQQESMLEDQYMNRYNMDPNYQSQGQGPMGEVRLEKKSGYMLSRPSEFKTHVRNAQPAYNWTKPRLGNSFEPEYYDPGPGAMQGSFYEVQPDLVPVSDGYSKFGLVMPEVSRMVSKPSRGLANAQKYAPGHQKDLTLGQLEQLRLNPDRCFHDKLNPKIAFSLAHEVKSGNSKAALKFARQRERADRHVIDESNVGYDGHRSRLQNAVGQQPHKPQDYYRGFGGQPELKRPSALAMNSAMSNSAYGSLPSFSGSMRRGATKLDNMIRSNTPEPAMSYGNDLGNNTQSGYYRSSSRPLSPMHQVQGYNSYQSFAAPDTTPQQSRRSRISVRKVKDNLDNKVAQPFQQQPSLAELMNKTLDGGQPTGQGYSDPSAYYPEYNYNQNRPADMTETEF